MAGRMHLLVTMLLLAAEPSESENPKLNPVVSETGVSHKKNEARPIGSSFSVYVSFLEPSVAVFVNQGVATASATTSAAFRLGAVLGARHAVLLGASLNIFQAAYQSGFGGSASILPSYRFYFSPLASRAFSPFVQLEGVIGINGIESSLWTVGGSPAFGAEHLFSEHFGVLVAIGPRVLYVFGNGFGALSVSLWSTIAVSIHF